MWDLPPPPGSGGREEEVWLAYGDYDFGGPPSKSVKKVGKKEKGRREADWEEGVRYGNLRTGEWRRRRWVRVVRRKVQSEVGGGQGR